MSAAADVFRANLNYLLEQTGQTALFTSAGAGIPNQTFNEWLRQGRTAVKGKGRDHFEALRTHFNRQFINKSYINSIADFWRGDLLDGFAAGVHARHSESASASAPVSVEETGLAALAEAVGKIVAARRWLDEEGRHLSPGEVVEGLHLAEVASEHLRHVGLALERQGSALVGGEDEDIWHCDKCGLADTSGRTYTFCSDCESYLCERCMIDDLCVDCHRRLAGEGQPDALNRSEEVADFVGGMTEDEAASLRDRLRQRTTQADYWGQGR